LFYIFLFWFIIRNNPIDSVVIYRGLRVLKAKTLTTFLKFVYSSNLVLFDRDKETAKLTFLKSDVEIPDPLCVLNFCIIKALISKNRNFIIDNLPMRVVSCINNLNIKYSYQERQREWPCDASATFNGFHIEKVLIPAS
jgi:hypothetical protein